MKKSTARRPAAAPAALAPTVVLLGNTTVRLIPTDGRRLKPAQAVELRTAEFLRRPFAHLPAAVRALLATPRPLVVCSVQTEALARLRAAAGRGAQPIHVYGADFGPGLPVRLANAAAARQVGRDRLAAALAARAEFPAGALVCDIGTALTINRVTARGFEGGLIAPGVQLSLQALHAGTSQLPAATLQHTPPFPAKATLQALQLGCLTAVAGAIEKVYAAELARLRKSRPRGSSADSLPLILTGGSAIIIRPWLERNVAARALLRPHLVATGVWLAFTAARPRKRR